MVGPLGAVFGLGVMEPAPAGRGRVDCVDWFGAAGDGDGMKRVQKQQEQ